MKLGVRQSRPEKKFTVKLAPRATPRSMHIAKSASVTTFKLPSLVRSSQPALKPPLRPEPVPPVPPKPCLDHYRLQRTVGTGTFSRVRIATQKATQEVVAIKIMSKQDIVKKRQVEHVRSERSTLSALTHPFIVNLKATFQDRDHLYMVLDYVAGGELYRLLRSKGSFTVKEAQFYAAEVVSALSYIHSQRVVYRDLKPENLLLTQTGHIKLTDFGFAKRLNPGERTFTMCGTPEYLAPEVIQQRGHDYACDWWGVGVLLYEMLSSNAPFTDPNPFKLYEKIINSPLSFPPEFDDCGEELVRGLLQKRVADRLTQAQTMAHEFFQGVDWTAVHLLKPPYVPPVRAPDDTSNFDQYSEVAEPVDPVPVAADLFQNF